MTKDNYKANNERKYKASDQCTSNRIPDAVETYR